MKKLLLVASLLTAYAGHLPAQPTISSFSPASGPSGSTVVINGASFDPVATNNTVYFGAVKASVQGGSATSLTVTVPAGATYQPVSVTANGRTAYSAQPFITTFTGDTLVAQTSFYAKTDLPTGYWPEALRVDDLNGDGKPDLVEVNSSGRLSIHPNTSTGGSLAFASRVNLVTAPYPRDIAISDFDGDGRKDIVVIQPDTLSLFRNTTAGSGLSFAPRVDVRTYSGSVVKAAVADVDNDGRPDLVVVSTASTNNVLVYRNTGAPGILSFSTPYGFSTGGSASAVSAGDLDGDRKPDLAVTSYNSNTLTVLQNSTTDSIPRFSTASTTTIATARHVIMADVSGDGKNDLLVALIGSNMVQVYKNTGTPGAISFAPKVDLPTGEGPIFIAAGEVNGDGQADLVVANANAASVSVFINTGSNGSISFAPKVDFATGDSPQWAALGDLNGDNKTDIAIANYSSGSVSVLRNKMNQPQNCTGTFVASAQVVAAPCGSPYAQGTATITTSGGVGTIQYSLDGGTFQSGNRFYPSIGTHKVTAKDDGGCLAEVVFTIYQAPSTVAITTSVMDITCTDTAGGVIVTPTGGTKPYRYKVLGNTYQTSNVFTNLLEGSYNVSVLDSNGCESQQVFSVRRRTEPRLIVRDSAACIAQPIDLTSPVFTAGSDPRLTFTYWTDSTATTPLATPTAVSTSGTYFIKGLLREGCFSIRPVHLSLMVLPDTPVVTPGGPILFCQGDSVTLTSSPAGNYQWYRDTTALPGATGQSLVAYQTGYYRVYTSNTCGTNASVPVYVKANASPATLPTPVISTSGDTVTCYKTGVWLYTSYISDVSYQWFRDGQLLTGATDTAYHVTTTSGRYSVSIFNACRSDTATSVPVNISVISYPDTPVISVGGPLSFCEGGSVKLTSSSSSSYGYQWYRDGVLIDSATAQSYTATTGGSYQVASVKIKCGTLSSPVTVAITPLPAKPTITRTGDSLVSSAPSGNQWYRDGAVIDGAVGRYYVTITPGIYTVLVTQNGCSALSAPYNFAGLPALSCPADVTVSTDANRCAATVTGIDPVLTPADTTTRVWYILSGATTGSGSGSVSGLSFNPGTTGVSYQLASDTSRRCFFTVTVQDKVAPVIDSVTATPEKLWPPDHRLVDVLVNYNSNDACGPSTCVISVSSNEPQNGLGDGDVDNDFEVVDNRHVRLRAERSSSGEGRIYTIKVQCTDTSGNVTTKNVVVTVPKGQFETTIGPNPSPTEFTLSTKSTSKEPMVVRVLDANGFLIEMRQNVAANGTITLGRGYGPGVYIVEFIQGSIRQTVRVIKMN